MATKETLKYQPPAQKTTRRKSADSKRQDAAVAVQEDRKNVRPDPRELPTLLQGAADEARERGAPPAQVEQILNALTGLTKLVSGLTDRILKLEEVKALPTIAKPYMPLKCPTCQQAIQDSTGRGVCTGTHVRVFVGPQNFQWYSKFPGVIWNGATYAGNHDLPPSIVDGIKAQVSAWEHNYAGLFMNRGKVFEPKELRALGSVGYSPIIH